MLIFVRSKETLAPSLHVNSYLTDLTYTFNKNHLEVLYIPYTTEEEQVERCQALAGNGFVGGLITDIIPDSHDKVCSYLNECGLPYMVLGYPKRNDTYCIYMTTPVLDGMIMEKCKLLGLSRCVQITGYNKYLFCREYPFVNGCMWHTAPHSISEESALQEQTLYAFTGFLAFSAAKRQGFCPKNYLVYESESLMPYVPDNI